jgi:hypothetical protein
MSSRIRFRRHLLSRPHSVVLMRDLPVRFRVASLHGLAGLVLSITALLGAAEANQAHLTLAALTQRIVAISARYRGTPYRRDPLGEGPAGKVDRDPLMCTTGVDCQTYVEQVLAEAIAPRPTDVLACLTRIRYRDGVVGFGTRNHYMVSDWLPHNRWLIRDVTDEVGESTTRPMEKWIDRAAFFRAHGAPELGRGVRPERSRTTYIPRAALSAAADRIPTAAVLIWVQDRPGIIAAHCGFAIRDARGALLLRHASERLGRVVDEPLLVFAQHASRHIVGVKVCVAAPLLDTSHSRR